LNYNVHDQHYEFAFSRRPSAERHRWAAHPWLLDLERVPGLGYVSRDTRLYRLIEFTPLHFHNMSMTFAHSRDLVVQSNGAVAVALVAPWIFVPGQIELSRAGSDSVSSADPGLYDTCCGADVAGAGNGSRSAWRCGDRQLHPTTWRAELQPHQQLQSRPPRRPQPPAPTVLHRSLQSIARDAQHGQHQLADHQH